MIHVHVAQERNTNSAVEENRKLFEKSTKIVKELGKRGFPNSFFVV